MKYAANTREDRITIALESCAASVKRLGGGRWDFELVNGKTMSATARQLEDWLLLDAPVSDRVARGDLWRLLRLNSGLEGLSKFLLMPPTWSVRLRADIPMVDEQDFESDCESESNGEMTVRLHDACAGLKEAFRGFAGESLSEHPGTITSDASQLQRLCSDAGWPFVERSAGKLVVDLDARGGFYQATIEQRGAGAHVSVEIARSHALAETSRQAMGALLLKTGALIRLARPAVEEDENQVAVRFEVRFGAMPTAVELIHALSSLSVACTLYGREARAITDENIAREYLAIGGVAAEYSGNLEEAMLAAAD